MGQANEIVVPEHSGREIDTYDLCDEILEFFNKSARDAPEGAHDLIWEIQRKAADQFIYEVSAQRKREGGKA